MIRRRLASVGCLLSFYVTAGAAPIAMMQISYDMSKTIINVGSGTGSISSVSTYSFVQSDYNGIDVVSSDLSGDGLVSVAAPGATASAEVNGGSAVIGTNSTTSNGAAVASSMITSDLFLDVQDVDFVSVTMDVSALLDVSVDDQGYEYAFGSIDNWFGLFYFDGASQAFVNSDSYSFLWDTNIDGLQSGSLNRTATLTLSYNFGSTYTGQLLIENIAKTFSEAQSYPTDVPEPTSLSLMAMGLAVLLPLALRRKK